jgi:hypothetical protein
LEKKISMQKYTINMLAAAARCTYVGGTTICKTLISWTPTPKYYSDRHIYQRPPMVVTYAGVWKQIRIGQIHLNCLHFSSEVQNIVSAVVNLHSCSNINSKLMLFTNVHKTCCLLCPQNAVYANVQKVCCVLCPQSRNQFRASQTQPRKPWPNILKSGRT